MRIATDSSAAGHPDMLLAETTIADWLRRIRAEYVEMPGLQLTELQVRRLWGLDPVVSEALLAALVDARFLRRTREGSYLRTDQS